jgi:endo-alpha-1,4-polygalactosaminidase (GH114 family)
MIVWCAGLDETNPNPHTTRWLWSVNFYTNRKGTAMYRKGKIMHKNTKHRIHKIERMAQNKNTNLKIILKNISRVIRK